MGEISMYVRRVPNQFGQPSRFVRTPDHREVAVPERLEAQAGGRDPP